MFRKNDIVKTINHTRLMVVEYYRTIEGHISKCGPGLKVVVTEGGYYDESDLSLVFRR